MGLREDYDEREVGNSVRKKRKNQEPAPVQPVCHIRAKLVRENIDIIFLRRSVIMDLLKEDPNAFKEKVKGCFVRVRHDPKDFYVKPRNLYQIAQVTGVIKGREEYEVGNVATNILLEVSNNNMKLLSVMEESFDEMDLDDLKELARKGIFKMPTVGEIEDKLKAVHEFIMRNWIKRELVKLPKLITVASLKNRLDEKYEYIERKKILEKPEEQELRIREMPVIIADPEEEKKIKKVKEEIIDLSNSDEEQNDENAPEQQQQEGNNGSNDERVWYYMDPQGQQQGPFSVEMLRNWRNNGFFDDNFEVWPSGLSSKDSVWLIDVLGISSHM